MMVAAVRPCEISGAPCSWSRLHGWPSWPTALGLDGRTLVGSPGTNSYRRRWRTVAVRAATDAAGRQRRPSVSENEAATSKFVLPAWVRKPERGRCGHRRNDGDLLSDRTPAGPTAGRICKRDHLADFAWRRRCHACHPTFWSACPCVQLQRQGSARPIAPPVGGADEAANAEGVRAPSDARPGRSRRRRHSDGACPNGGLRLGVASHRQPWGRRRPLPRRPRARPPTTPAVQAA